MKSPAPCSSGINIVENHLDKWMVLDIFSRSRMALVKLDGRLLFRRERTRSGAVTVPNFKEPATRSMSSQFRAIRSTLTKCLASVFNCAHAGALINAPRESI